MAEQITLQMVLDAVASLGAIGVLGLIVLWFYRGDILSRRVYSEMTRHILEELCDRVILEMREMIRELNGGNGNE